MSNADKNELFFSDKLWSHYGAIKKFIYAMTLDDYLTDDLTQNTFLTCWSKVETVKGYKNIRGALMAIGRNEFLQWCRSNKEEAESNSFDETSRLRWMTGPSNIEDLIRKDNHLHELMLLFEGVKKEYIQVVILVDYYGYTVKEVAKLLDRNYNTVASQHVRGLEEMRQKKELMIEMAKRRAK